MDEWKSDRKLHCDQHSGAGHGSLSWRRCRASVAAQGIQAEGEGCGEGGFGLNGCGMRRGGFF